MSIEIRSPSEDEIREVMKVGHAAFGGEQKDEDYERERKIMPLDRFMAAYDDGQPVGTAAAYPFQLRIPGGDLAAAGVTWVGVVPSHRRRGILSEFMRRQLEDTHERGEPIAVLFASEAAIYGRYGYGIAAPGLSLRGERARFAFRDDPGRTGGIRLVDRDEARRLFPPVHEAARRATPGMFARSDAWWDANSLNDPEHWRHGAGPKFYVVLELDGAVAGYAIYRVKDEWDQGMPRGEVRVIEVTATSSAATRELWRFLFGIDLVAHVQQWLFDPGSPLFLMVVDPRSLHLSISDGLWLRFVDLESALRGRSYTADGAVVLEVRDELCPWNSGRWRLGEGVERTDKEPELELDVADLASAYLGAFDFHRLAAAARVRELRPGALARASALFRSERPPYCPEIF
jgi:predicted acetyltransferase